MPYLWKVNTMICRNALITHGFRGLVRVEQGIRAIVAEIQGDILGRYLI
jgi:hypothetical protein